MTHASLAFHTKDGGAILRSCAAEGVSLCDATRVVLVLRVV